MSSAPLFLTQDRAAALMWWHYDQGVFASPCWDPRLEWPADSSKPLTPDHAPTTKSSHPPDARLSSLDTAPDLATPPLPSPSPQDPQFLRGPWESKGQALQALRDLMSSLDGAGLAATATNMVFGEGDYNSPLMLVGEAPGAEEDRQGKPFVGPSGQLLEAMLASIGWSRARVYISNTVNWRPPFNRQPSGAEIAACLPWLRHHIRLVAPKMLVAVGGVAAKALTSSTATMTTLQTQDLFYAPDPLDPTWKIPLKILYHPAFLLRAPGNKRTAWAQLRAIKRHLETLVTPD